VFILTKKNIYFSDYSIVIRLIENIFNKPDFIILKKNIFYVLFIG